MKNARQVLSGCKCGMTVYAQKYIICFALFWGHVWLCLGVTPGSVHKGLLSHCRTICGA